ncbi:hypothetical protein [Mycobacterium sp. 852014-50255_SCH5639931]|uniref:hypothetical protein n=1 Tax=Mycobacterium sp. 852014-50255_SCH5639931 TaxID=1834112 RepID=UPI000800E1C1|nr:hypothetical protein [Mycobacterium sp. 852014-50255_SCH5639931]OBB64886.1 hypothetical protein A5758_19875 [Mycobacterium sp. 852014-50255_SCH5639931]
MEIFRAARAVRDRVARGYAVHFDDYRVFASPLADFTREMQRRGIADRIIEVTSGASVTV